MSDHGANPTAVRAAIAKEIDRVAEYREADNTLASPLQNISTSRGKLMIQSYKTKTSNR